MKRLSILLILLFFGVSLVFADQSVLIDFTQLEADDQVDGRPMHFATMVDFSGQAGASYTQEEKDRMLISLALPDWEIKLASSSQTTENLRYSKTRAATSRTYGQVLGARIHFPTGSYNSFAIVEPPFEIPAYQRPTVYDPDESELREMTDEEIAAENDQRSQEAGRELQAGDPGYLEDNGKFDGFGVIKNVGDIKEIQVEVYGQNYPHGLSLRYKDQSGAVHDIFMDHLRFDGWKKIVWRNPNYIQSVRDRELYSLPLYPQAFPFMKFLGFIIHRDGANIGSDFVVYFKDVQVIYDKAVITQDRDIEDEEVWGILEEREAARRAAEIRRLGNVQVLRYLEKKKQALETESFDESEAEQGNGEGE